MSAAQTRRGDQVDDAVDPHDLERVDFVADAHGAELRGEAGSHLGRECDSGHERSDFAGVRE